VDEPCDPKFLTKVGQKSHPFLDSVFLHLKIHQKFEPKIGFKSWRRKFFKMPNLHIKDQGRAPVKTIFFSKKIEQLSN
jgi:hypothetical protein